MNEKHIDEDGYFCMEAGRRLAVRSTHDGDGNERKGWHHDAWFYAYSPRNENAHGEGQWEDWVKLAEMILQHDSEMKAKGKA